MTVFSQRHTYREWNNSKFCIYNCNVYENQIISNSNITLRNGERLFWTIGNYWRNLLKSINSIPSISDFQYSRGYFKINSTFNINNYISITYSGWLPTKIHVVYGLITWIVQPDFPDIVKCYVPTILLYVKTPENTIVPIYRYTVTSIRKLDFLDVIKENCSVPMI